MPPSSRLTALPLLIAALTTTITTTVLAQTNPLPYNPTRILLSPNTTHAYILQPLEDNNNQAQLRSLSLISGIGTDDQDFRTVQRNLPFLDADRELAYTPVIDESGDITVAVGECSRGAAGAAVWRWSTSNGDSGEWTEYGVSTTSTNNDIDSTHLVGINFLSSGLSFSERPVSNNGDDDAKSNLYVFGGMCPTDSVEDGNLETWTSAANYSDQMLTLMPQGSDDGDVDYSVEMVAGRGPPIAEAGFSVTPLTPTFSFGSGEDGVDDEPRARQQSFVLLGGHTQTAFINMSQVALFSLPQESWSFLPVSQPSSQQGDPDTGLATRQASVRDVEPRSGHTAVLSEDGSKVVLFGGWVGDVGTPAEPQLAVLNVGSGFGGEGNDWSWSVPEQDEEHSSGIYGHGAAMLPGDVMMVTGGYSIGSSSLKRVKRAATDRVSLFNVSSNAWITTYEPPQRYLDAMSEQQTSEGALTTTSQKAGLAVGLILGVLLLIALVLFYFWYTKRLKQARQDREQEAASSHSRGMSQIGQPFLQSHTSYTDDRSALSRFWTAPPKPATQAYPWDTNGSQPFLHGDRQADATGLLLNVPSPTRGLRKGVAGRPYGYHKAPRYDDKRISRGSGSIHPIAEQEDEDEQSNRANSVSRGQDSTYSEAQQHLRDVESVFTPNANMQLRDIEKALEARPVRPISDPFRDPSPQPNPLGSHPVSPELDTNAATLRRVPTEREHDYPNLARIHTDGSKNWVYPSDPVDYDEDGRASPLPSNSDERTSSTLSDRSQRSTVSENSITRTMSNRTSNLLMTQLGIKTSDSHQYSSPENSPVDDNRVYSFTNSTGGRKSPFIQESPPRRNRARSATAGSATAAGADADLFATGRSNFVDLQQEGTTLLGGMHSQQNPSTYDRDDPYQRALAAHSNSRQPVRQPTVRYADSAAPGANDHDYIPTQLISKRPRQGWMGSLRRAIGAMSERSFSLTSNPATSNANPHQNSHTATSSSSGAMGEDDTEAPSPTKRYHSLRQQRMQNSPRRALSDGGAEALLRSKRGKDDWNEDEPLAPNLWEPFTDDPGNDWGQDETATAKTKKTHQPLARSVTHGGNWARSPPRDQRYRDDPSDSAAPSAKNNPTISLDQPKPSDDDDEDWDVETAARKRDVQVMFTIPKTRLRVVNADVGDDGNSLRSLSEGGLSRGGGGGSLRRGNSVLSRSKGGGGGSRRSARSARSVSEGLKEGRLVDVDGEEGDVNVDGGGGGGEEGAIKKVREESSEEEFPPRFKSKGKRKAA
ncbi:hypothetical protein MBLNU230_g8172t1 [Neophaeotheca triangularis]